MNKLYTIMTIFILSMSNVMADFKLLNFTCDAMQEKFKDKSAEKADYEFEFKFIVSGGQGFMCGDSDNCCRLSTDLQTGVMSETDKYFKCVQTNKSSIFYKEEEEILLIKKNSYEFVLTTNGIPKNNTKEFVRKITGSCQQ